ncbi:MAG: nickel pincer cofactor biosynthesis protein LarC [Frankiaceae bacterium]|nr:nickel pincer cofactor biosynthesis protein LarC [Frankiaceae bacterium]
MFLGVLVDAGVPLSVLQEAVDAIGVEPIVLRTEDVTRAGLGATRVHVETGQTAVTRTWADVRGLVEEAALDPQVGATALAVFARLARAEADVHRVPVDDVHFHEVGALDAIADVVATCAGLDRLGLTRLTASPVALGSGRARGAHGPLPVPVPAVLALLTGVPVRAGAAPHEMTTPTGAALLAEAVTDWGELPPMTVTRTATGAGGRDPEEVANVLRLVVGEPLDGTTSALLVETNVDDLDPRLWPGVLQALLDVGASDAWLTPILMKKGRPAHTLSVLCGDDVLDAVRRVVFTETSTIGLRTQRVGKHALERTDAVVDVGGQRIRVKVATYDGAVVNANPEYDDVVAAAQALGRPVKAVLAEAAAAAQTARKNASAPD